MLGNVLQWSSDRYDAKYYDQQESVDPKGPDSGQERVLRGGSYSSNPPDVRVSSRDRYGPGSRSFNVGVRCIGE
jgi:formylglycine-generating enzyme required for sulfatase activity